jgi:uncharacterized protein YdaL
VCRARRDFLRGSLAAAAASSLPWPRALEGSPRVSPGGTGGNLLLLHDTAGPFGWLSTLQARMLENLLSRFRRRRPDGTFTAVERRPVEQYVRGQMARHRAAFYLGGTYDNPLPQAFKDDVLASATPLMWMNYNLHQVALLPDSTPDPAFAQRFGFAYTGQVTGPYSTVQYRRAEFTKHLEIGGTSTELGRTRVTDPARAGVVAWARTASPPERVPYIVRGGSLWYVADSPFSFISEEDRYLAFCDVLFDVCGLTRPPTRRGLVRFEDVSGAADPLALRACADACRARDVPFAVALIPEYRDPLGVYNNGVPETIRLRDAPEVAAALQYMVQQGGEMVMHGFTHQFESVANPYNGVSADDFEFFRVTENADHTLNFLGAVPGDSTAWARGRLQAARAEMQAVGLTPVAFEAPHYAASAADYAAFVQELPLCYHRTLYFEGEHFTGQFFPYVIPRDGHGQKLLPENLGNVELLPWPDPETGPFPKRLPADIIRAAARNAQLRDAWASFYFHPFLDVSYLTETLDGLLDLGYVFQRPSQVVL